tara:strand:+ start:260 stop:532 length:273 start_codon:yes stop_codon:yes gene_type:complete
MNNSIYDYSGHTFDELELNHENNSNLSCPCCVTLPCKCMSKIYSVACLPIRLCMGVTWVGTCGMFFYLGSLYEKGELFDIDKLELISDMN